jgi:RHS repeat-associated protein
VTTDYLWDRASGLPHLLAEGTTRAARAGGSLAEVDDATGDHARDLQDALGSVRAQTDDTATVTGTADWDAWGNASAGGAGLFGWDGEQSDPENGLSFLRARYYSPVFGQFVSRDPLGAGSGTQRSAYVFAADTPATLGDPSGPNVRFRRGVSVSPRWRWRGAR